MPSIIENNGRRVGGADGGGVEKDGADSISNDLYCLETGLEITDGNRETGKEKRKWSAILCNDDILQFAHEVYRH